MIILNYITYFPNLSYYKIRLPGSPRVSIVKNRSVCLFGLYLLFLVGFDRDQFNVPEESK